MSKRNYTQYSNKNKKPAEAEEKSNVTTPVTDVVVETVTPEKITTPEPVATVEGVVVPQGLDARRRGCDSNP